MAGVQGGHGLEQGLESPDLLEGKDVNLQGEEGVYNEVYLGGDAPNVPRNEDESRMSAQVEGGEVEGLQVAGPGRRWEEEGVVGVKAGGARANWG